MSAVVHQAVLEVNEEGAEAAAATGVVMAFDLVAMLPKPKPRFRADRPFLVAIIKGNRVAFFGRVTNPTA